MNIMDMPLSVLSGVGPKRQKDLESLGINRIYDLIHYFPSKYEDRTTFLDICELKPGDIVCIKCKLRSAVKTFRMRKNMTISSCTAEDETGCIRVVWYNQRFIDKNLKQDDEIILYGKAVKGKAGIEIQNPKYEKADKSVASGRIMPVYSLKGCFAHKSFVKLMQEALKLAAPVNISFIPSAVEKQYGLMDVNTALQKIHFPENEGQATEARNRFVFEEFFVLMAAIAKLRHKGRKKGIPFNDTDTEKIENNLPFSLTNAQKKVINDIKSDILCEKCVNRLVQGDVGSGKTIVAFITLILAVRNGLQGAIMAPTEILAKQHYNTLKSLFPDINAVVLTSSVKGKEKIKVLESIANGQAQIIIGTHSLIEPDVVFYRLGAVVADEQHKFGVRQRQKLIEKGENPHLIVMTATPIPRTLSLIMYGDLDISVIDELPPGRQKIKTNLVDESLRKRAYNFTYKKIKDGEQVYIVCPLVEDSETLELKSVSEFSEGIKTLMPDVKIGILHGKMKDNEKEEIMQKFKANDISVLVSTTVIEVGIDVPNATVMIIENAERFGLSQLHQLRGRVGRGKKQSYCIMFSDTKNPETYDRLKVIESSNDGFYISEQDLKFRGPGDFIGTKQHGMPILKSAVSETDTKVLYDAKDAVDKIFKKAIILTETERKCLNYAVNKVLFGKNNSNILN